MFLVLQGDFVFSRDYLARAHNLQVRAVLPLVASWEGRASPPHVSLFLPVKYVGCYFSVFQTRINLGVSGPAAARVLSNISAMLGAKAGQADLHTVLLLIACVWRWAAQSSRCWQSPFPTAVSADGNYRQYVFLICALIQVVWLLLIGLSLFGSSVA